MKMFLSFFWILTLVEGTNAFSDNIPRAPVPRAGQAAGEMIDDKLTKDESTSSTQASKVSPVVSSDSSDARVLAPNPFFSRARDSISRAGKIFRSSSQALQESVNVVNSKGCPPKKYVCTADPSVTVPDNLSELMTAFTTPEIGNSRSCSNCMTPELEKFFSGDESAAQVAIDEYKNKLVQKLRPELNKKMLDDFTKNFENIRFFVANAGNVFSGDKKGKSLTSEKIEQLHCSDPKMFQDAVEKECKNNPKKNERARAIFEAFGDKFNEDYPLEKIAASILTSGSNPPDKDARKKEDQIRYTFTKEPNGPFMKGDAFLTSLLKNADAVNEVSITCRHSGKTPMEAIYHILERDLKNPEVPGILAGLLSKDILGEELFNQKSSPERINDVFEKLDQVLSWTRDLHPAIDSMLTDADLFRDSAKLLNQNSGSKTISTALENSTQMQHYFSRRCDDLKEKFSQLVCKTDDELLAASSKVDLNRLASTDDPKEKMLSAVFVCQKGEVASKASWKSFPIDQQLGKPSDFYECRKPEKNNYVYRSQICQARHTHDTETRDYTNMMTDIYGGSSSGLKKDYYGSRVVEAAFNLDLPPSADFLSSSDQERSRSSSSETKSIEPKKEDPVTALTEPQIVQAGFNQAYSPNAPNALMNNNNSQRVTSDGNERQNLREPASEDQSDQGEKGEGKKVDPEISDPLILQQLAQFKEDLRRGQERLEQVLEENKRLRQQSEDNAKALEDKRAQLIDQFGNKANDVSRFNATSGLGREIGSLNDFSNVNRQANSGAGGFGALVNPTGPAEGRIKSLGGMNNVLSSSYASRENVSSPDPIIISASGARSSGLEVKSSEVSLDIIDFVEKTNNVQELLRIRSSGMKYRYQTADGSYLEMFVDYKNLDEKIKSLIDQKIAESKVAGPELNKLNDDIRRMRRTVELAHLKIQLAESMKLKPNKK